MFSFQLNVCVCFSSQVHIFKVFQSTNSATPKGEGEVSNEAAAELSPEAKGIFFYILFKFNKATELRSMSGPWTTLEEDHIAFLLPAPKCTNCIGQVLMLELSKTDT
jgi:hypothetical protein